MVNNPSHQAGRVYKRYPGQVWEGHKKTIRELFLDQDKTHDEVATILADCHGITVGARQIKRWTGKWGFVKNIPAAEMRKMVRARHRREQRLGRPTKFLRDPGTGGFQEVPSAKLDAYQQRFGSPCVSTLSSSSGMPSNIMCQTPSSCAALTTTSRAGSSQISSAPPGPQGMAQEFNSSAVHVFAGGGSTNGHRDEAGRDSDTAQTGLAIKKASTLVCGAVYDVFNGNYQPAAQKMKRAVQLNSCYVNRVVCQFRIDVLDSTCYPGHPQSLVARIADILTRTLSREREKYANSSSGIRNILTLHTMLSTLRTDAQFFAEVLVQQRALQIWRPLLNPDDPRIKGLRAGLARTRSTYRIAQRCSEDSTDGAETDVLSELPERYQMQSMGERLGILVQLGDAPSDQLMEKLRIIETGSCPGKRLTLELEQQRRGRSKALLGIIFSFVGRFTDAEQAFEVSEQLMEHETCAEIKLYRMLWYAEHKTRVQDWNNVARLITRAHEIFMDNETNSEFIMHHFPDRFVSLCAAVSRRVPIDASTEAAADFATEIAQPPSPAPDTPNIAHLSPTPEHSVLSPQKLFPPTPRGAHAVINIDAWREFVQFAPTAGMHP